MLDLCERLWRIGEQPTELLVRDERLPAQHFGVPAWWFLLWFLRLVGSVDDWRLEFDHKVSTARASRVPRERLDPPKLALGERDARR